MRQIMILLVLVLLPSISEATILLSEDFEGVPTGYVTLNTGGGAGTGPTGVALTARGWFSIFCGTTLPCTSEIVQGIGHNGTTTTMLRMRYDGQHCQAGGINCRDDLDSSLKRNFTATSEIWDRYWVYYTPIDTDNTPVPWNFTTSGFNQSMKQHEYNQTSSLGGQVILEFLQNQTMTNNIGWISSHPTAEEICHDAEGNGITKSACVYPANVATPGMTINTWYCVESHLKYNTTGTTGTVGQDGIVEVYVNGTKTANYTNAGMRWNSIPGGVPTELMVQRQGADNLFRYEDDIAVGTTRFNDCGAVPPPDTTPPAAPTGVMVTMLATAMIFGGFYGSLTAKRVSPDRLALGDDSADSATLRTVAVHGSKDGIGAMYVVPAADRAGIPAASLLGADRAVADATPDTKAVD